jgi:hypothetical protein
MRRAPMDTRWSSATRLVFGSATSANSSCGSCSAAALSALCQVIVDEREDEIYVRVVMHRALEADGPTPANRGYTDCPVRASLVRPLGERPVIGMDSDEELPLYTPKYLDNVVQADHGYRPVSRRRRAPRADTRLRISGASTRPPEAE